MSATSRLPSWLFVDDPQSTDTKRTQRRLVRKLDVFFLSYLSMSAVVKSLDQSNISNAYVSGMQTDLNIQGNEYNYFTTFFNIGYMIVIPFSSYMINDHVRPSLWIPIAELLWGLATACLAVAKNYQQVYGLRFMVGFCEGTAWPAAMVLMLSWYTPREVGLRIAIYEMFAYSGGMWGGFLQAALYTNLNGSHGLAGWQWLFVVNACMTFAVALYGFWACPDYPSKPNPAATWLTSDEVEVGLERMRNLKRASPTGWSWKTVRTVFTRPENWAVFFVFQLGNLSLGGASYFNLWLKSLKKADGTLRFTTQQINYIPTAGSAMTIIGELLLMPLSSRLGLQWPFLLLVYSIALVFTSILAAWTVADSLKLASFIILGFAQVYQHLVVTWIGNLLGHSAEERSFMVGICVVGVYGFNAGVPLRVWPASQAPLYNIGWKFAAAMSAAAIISVFATLFFEKRRRAKTSLSSDNDSVSSNTDPVTEHEDTKNISPLSTPSAHRQMIALAAMSSLIISRNVREKIAGSYIVVASEASIHYRTTWIAIISDLVFLSLLSLLLRFLLIRENHRRNGLPTTPVTAVADAGKAPIDTVNVVAVEGEGEIEK